MPKLLLIKHASPLRQPDLPPERWPLSDEGRQKCDLLAQRIAEHRPNVVVSSDELKARETAEILATHLTVSMKTAPGLHEHDRSSVPQLRSGEFISMIELMLRRPDELVLGEETANGALSRFDRAIRRVIDEHPNQDLAIVSHGTVIAMLLAKYSNRAAFALWREMGLPSYAVLSLPGLVLQELCPSVRG
jgi:broad specificity phosphatase PhoE